MTTPPARKRRQSAGFVPPRIEGFSAFAQWLERRLPEWLLRHGLAVMWVWVLAWGAVALTEELTEVPPWVFTLATVLMVVPSLIATGICLWVTPRKLLRQTQSILSHFVARFVTVIFAFLAWTVSIVIGASISSIIQLAAENREKEVLGTGFQLMAAIGPIVAILIWIGLILRCCGFLVRLRGWAARPVDTSLPHTFLAHAPHTRQWTITLAHPGLLATAGLLSALGTIFMYIGGAGLDLTF